MDWLSTETAAAAEAARHSTKYAVLLRHGTMELGFYGPRGLDPQQPHERDELYVVTSGRARFVRGEESRDVSAGDAIFVPAAMPHRFEGMSDDFGTWVVFYGPEGGEEPEA